jgi:hypothetical protein
MSLFSGYGGFHFGERDHTELNRLIDDQKNKLSLGDQKLKDLGANLAAQVDVVGTLKQQLTAAQTQFNGEMSSRQSKFDSDLATKESLLKKATDQAKQVQAQLANEIANRDGLLARAKANLDATTQKLRQTETDRDSKDSEAKRLSKQLDAEQKRQKFGVLTWSGDVQGGKTIDIRNGRLTPGLTGSLPGTACSLEPGDPERYTVVNLASDCTRVALRFDKKVRGKTTARLFWGLK